MRSAGAADAPALREMVLARSVWLERRGLRGWRDSADRFAARCSRHAGNVWLLEHRGRVVGHTVLHRLGPPWGWTQAELAEPALYLSDTVTDPEYRRLRPGTLIALWAVDRAAREGARWVRRDCGPRPLAAYYQWQGFRVVHEVQGPPRPLFSLARRAQRLPGLAPAVREASSGRAPAAPGDVPAAGRP